MSDTEIDSTVFARIEREHPDGVSSSEIVDILSSLGIRFSESTLRKWVQLGLLPKSVRVARKGKHAGSQGMYPVSMIRQIMRIREMMAADLTIEQIQKEVLFVRSDIEELERSLGRIFRALDESLDQLRQEPVGFALTQDVSAARDLAQSLVNKLESIEARLISRATMGSTRVATG